MPKHVGILTSGGDCPGLNAVIRAVVRRIVNEGGSCVGIFEGWRGLVQGMSRPLDLCDTDVSATGARKIMQSPHARPDLRVVHGTR